MSAFLKRGSKPYRALEYLIYHPDGMNAQIAYREFGDMNLHSTISSLRNGHGANFIRAYPIYGKHGRPKQYFIAPRDMTRARRMLRDARPSRKPISVKGRVPIGEIEIEA